MCKSTICECSMCAVVCTKTIQKEEKKSNTIAKRVLNGLHINMYKIVCRQAIENRRQTSSRIKKERKKILKQIPKRLYAYMHALKNLFRRRQGLFN